jgi:hypothetical protein
MMAGINPALAQHPAFAAAYQQQIQQQMMMQQQQQMAMVSGARAAPVLCLCGTGQDVCFTFQEKVEHGMAIHTCALPRLGWSHGSNWGHLCQALVCADAGELGCC